MHNRNLLVLFILIGIALLFAIQTILAQDNSGHGHGSGNGNNNSSQVVQPTQNSNNGNHQGGGNNGNGNGNGGSQNHDNKPAPQPTTVPQQGTAQLGCQKNNPSRLDCSSLDVSGRCDAGTAVFTIHNSGSPGDGDMRAATQYRIVVDGVVVQTGSIQLAGGASMQITYSGGGSATLEADQQVGHPGNSHPRVSLDCGPSSQTPTVEPTQEVTPTDEPTVTDTPTVIAPDLSVNVICMDDGSTLFVVMNNGGNMLDEANYSVADADNNMIDTGVIQLSAGQQTSLQYWSATSLTLTIGDLVVVASPQCVPSTPEVSPTVEPTVIAPDLAGDSSCQPDGTILFVIYNNGGDMTDPMYYSVTDSNNAIVGDGYAQVMAGQSYSLYFAGYSSLTFTMGDLVITSPDCGPVATPEPTVEVTPSPDPVLKGSVSCQDDGSIIFDIINTGGDMPAPVDYSVATPDNIQIDSGWLQLMAGESTDLQYWGYTRLTFRMGDLVLTQDAECIPPTPEVSPTPEPTQEVTPTLQPTDEVTPTVEPTQTATPTPTGTLGCQKNNPDRRDCSSLQVTGKCQNGAAVFTIRNMGKPSEGDMVSPTQYRIIVGGVVVQTGTVQLIGGTAVQITYTGGGSVTLEVDQQTGHPGSSQPQATVSC
jgi:hypothetical protein